MDGYNQKEWNYGRMEENKLAVINTLLKLLP